MDNSLISYSFHYKCARRCMHGRELLKDKKDDEIVGYSKWHNKTITVKKTDFLKFLQTNIPCNPCHYYNNKYVYNGGMVLIGRKEIIDKFAHEGFKLYQKLKDDPIRDIGIPVSISLKDHVKSFIEYQKKLECHTHPGKKYNHCKSCKFKRGFNFNRCSNIIPKELNKYHALCIIEKSYNEKTTNDVNFMVGKNDFKVSDADYRYESPYETALREGWEESGIQLSENAIAILRKEANKYGLDYIPVCKWNMMYYFVIPDTIDFEITITGKDHLERLYAKPVL